MPDLAPCPLLALARRPSPGRARRAPPAPQRRGRRAIAMAQIIDPRADHHPRARVSAGDRAPVPSSTPLPPIEWKEKKGPKCVAVAELAGASIARPTASTWCMQRRHAAARAAGRRLPAARFLTGFYLRPAGDGMVCADRDAIRMRSGASARSMRSGRWCREARNPRGCTNRFLDICGRNPRARDACADAHLRGVHFPDICMSFADLGLSDELLQRGRPTPAIPSRRRSRPARSRAC